MVVDGVSNYPVMMSQHAFKVVAAMDNQKEMTMWMKTDENRTIFQALSPANLEYERMPNQPYKVIDQPVLTFVARQKGEA